MSAIVGMGTALPSGKLTNAHLEATLDTTDEWIFDRTGIRERRIAGPDDTTVTLATAAGAEAIKDSGVDPELIDLVVLATLTPVQQLPASSVYVQDSLGLSAGAFDLAAACSGFVYSLVMADALVNTGGARAALIIGAEVLTDVVDPTDRGTRILFGDGAAAAVIVPSAPGYGVLGFDLGCDGSAAEILEIQRDAPFVTMDGKEVFRRAVRACVQSANNAMERAGVSSADIDIFVPHQANTRIIDAIMERCGIDDSKCIRNIDRYGNTSAASIPLALSEAEPHDGDLVLLCGFGAGMTWASAVIRWGTGL
ncbi:MAG TPA: beta-ketoacyl-ACP synthase III [Acidimicrobiales bacterium]|nr:beta-ketoacyl-ACP synthase III [Acidimicrobiales bacterium]